MNLGDRCRECPHGHLVIYCTRTLGERVTRYLQCNCCGGKPDANKLIAPLSDRRPYHRRVLKRLTLERRGSRVES